MVLKIIIRRKYVRYDLIKSACPVLSISGGPSEPPRARNKTRNKLSILSLNKTEPSFLESESRAGRSSYNVLGDPEVTANIYCKSNNLPNTDTQNYSTDLR